MVNLEERPAGGDRADRPDRPNGSPEGSGETFDLYCGPIPKASASADVTAAHGQRLAQAAVQRGRPRRLQVSVGFDPEGHSEPSGMVLREQTCAQGVDDGSEVLGFMSAASHSVFMSCET